MAVPGSARSAGSLPSLRFASPGSQAHHRTFPFPSPHPPLPLLLPLPWDSGIIDGEKKVRQSKLAARIKKSIMDPSSVNIKLKQEHVDVAAPVLLQSGGKYDLDLAKGGASDDVLSYDTIVCGVSARCVALCSFGRNEGKGEGGERGGGRIGLNLGCPAATSPASRLACARPRIAVHRSIARADSPPPPVAPAPPLRSYSSYCATVARTYFVDPSDRQAAVYRALSAAQAAAIASIVDGAPFSAPRLAAVESLKAAGEEGLVERLAPSIGWSIGLEFEDRTLPLAGDSSSTIRPGMAFSVQLGAWQTERRG